VFKNLALGNKTMEQKVAVVMVFLLVGVVGILFLKRSLLLI
jgi:hypothetical protein